MLIPNNMIMKTCLPTEINAVFIRKRVIARLNPPIAVDNLLGLTEELIAFFIHRFIFPPFIRCRWWCL
jgi:hypothetical protein